MEMPVADGLDLIQFALDKDEDDKLFSRWIGMAQYEMSFEDFKNNLRMPRFKPDEEVMSDVKNILDSMR